MKKLTLVRHAKSSWDDPSLNDIERPLSSRGLNDVVMVAKAFAAQQPDVDKISCSIAVRARDTVSFFATELNYPHNKIEYDSFLYSASAREVFFRIKREDSHCQHLMLVGHDTYLAELTTMLCGEDVKKFYTSGCFCLELNVKNWEEISPGCGKKLFFLHPKSLQE